MKKCLCCENTVTSPSFFYEDVLCGRCRSELPVELIQQSWRGYQLVTLYRYKEPFRSIMLAIKAKSDVALIPALLSPFVWYLRLRFFGYRVVIAPSTPQLQRQRGFNHLDKLCRTIGWKPQDIFIKEAHWKQTDQTWQNRKNIKHYLHLRHPIRSKRAYVIVDDIVTSGETLFACAELLKKQGVRKIVLFAIGNNQQK